MAVNMKFQVHEHLNGRDITKPFWIHAKVKHIRKLPGSDSCYYIGLEDKRGINCNTHIPKIQFNRYPIFSGQCYVMQIEPYKWGDNEHMPLVSDVAYWSNFEFIVPSYDNPNHEINKLLHEKKLIEAIRHLRDYTRRYVADATTKIGLKEAKDIIEAREAEIKAGKVD